MPKKEPVAAPLPIRIAPPTRAAIRRALGNWYTANRRNLPWRRSADPYAVWISEVMLQQTQVKTVTPYYHRFLKRFPDVFTLANADVQVVLKHWEGLGYYSRARNLHKAAGVVVDQMEGRFPDTWEEIRLLPGIGDYIASAVLSIAFGLPYAVVDGNVKRVLARLFRLAWPASQPSAHRHFQNMADQLIDRRHPGDHNQAVMELGALVCTPRQPDCPGCSVSKYCSALKFGEVMHYPVRTIRAPVPNRRIAVGLVEKKGRVLLVQRAENGLLGGLWEFPGGEMDSGDDPENVCKDRIKSRVNLDVSVDTHMATVHHTYTHFKLRMEVFRCRWISGRVRLNGPAGFKWIALSRISHLPLHGAVHKALKKIAQY